MTRILWKDESDWPQLVLFVYSVHFSVEIDCNWITWSVVVFFEPVFPKIAMWAFSRLIVSPSCSLLVIARVELFQRLGRESLVVSDVSSTVDFVSYRQLWRLSPQNQMLSLNDEFTSVLMLSIVPASLSNFDSDFIAFLLSLQRLEHLDFNLFFLHRITTDRVSVMLWRLFFSFSVREIVTQRTSFSLESSRALIITIRIATIKNPFLAVSISCSDSFQHLNFYQSRKIQSSPRLLRQAQSPRQLAENR